MDFQKCVLYGVRNRKYLSELLHIEVKKLRNIDEFFFTDYYVLRKPNKDRYIYAPKLEYKKILKKVHQYLLKLEVPDFAIGGMKGKNYYMNGLHHINSTHFMLLDIKDFYPSTSDYYVYGFFKDKLNMPSDIAKICTLLVTEPCPHQAERRHLPQGYPTSSLISFFAYIDMYEKLSRYANTENVKFTSFVDDLTFSSHAYVNKSFKRNIKDIISQYGFQVNNKKTVHRKINKGINITGTYIRGKQLFAPNSLQRNMISTYSELRTAFEGCQEDLNHLEFLCNRLQGYLINVKLIEEERPLNYMGDLVAKVRKYIKKEKNNIRR